jgi:hypothetical protein
MHGFFASLRVTIEWECEGYDNVSARERDLIQED